MEKQNETPKYIAIDSDILRELSFLRMLRKEYGHNINPEKLPLNSALKKDFNYFILLLNCIEHDEIRIVIVDAVYQESKHSPSLIDFIKKYCYFPNITAVNYQEKAEKARALASAYCSEYVYKGEKKPAPMKSVFIADINKYAPSNDCYIMAQATVEGLPLLTGNGKDFVFNNRNPNNSQRKNNHDRVKGIVQVNILNKYFTMQENDKKIASAPMLLYELAPILRQVNEFRTPEQSNDFIEAMDIL